MPWIQNVSLIAVGKGLHFDAGSKSVLIQITDPGTEPPKPLHKFRRTHQFRFLDIEVEDDEFAVTKGMALALVNILQNALDNDMNVIVHCHAGICRSGAVAEVGTMMGFEDTEAMRIPNLLVKHLMMDALGWGYSKEPITELTAEELIKLNYNE